MDELLIIKSSENTNFNDVRLFIVCFFSMLQPCEEDDVIGFYLTLSLDVLFEVLRFGDRHRLTKLERVGRRLHHLVEKWFGEMPFLRLDIRLEPLTLGFAFFYLNKLRFIIGVFFSVRRWRQLLVVTKQRFHLQICPNFRHFFVSTMFYYNTAVAHNHFSQSVAYLKTV